MKLLIVESPTKAKAIEKYLGGEYTVRASVGHVRDLPKSNKKAIEIENGFKPHYEVDPKKLGVLKELRDLAKRASEIVLATDPDREGEAISWHLKDELKLDTAVRVTYNEITESAIREALKHPREIDMNLKEAQEARRVLDRLVGYDLSQIVWKKVRYGLSAGRVQSPALRIICEREREIRAFIPEEYYQIFAEVETVGKIKESKKYKIVLECVEEPKEAKVAEHIVASAQAYPWKVLDVEVSEP
jgi:DNA topoisomerase-1